MCKMVYMNLLIFLYLYEILYSKIYPIIALIIYDLKTFYHIFRNILLMIRIFICKLTGIYCRVGFLLSNSKNSSIFNKTTLKK